MEVTGLFTAVQVAFIVFNQDKAKSVTKDLLPGVLRFSILLCIKTSECRKYFIHLKVCAQSRALIETLLLLQNWSLCHNIQINLYLQPTTAVQERKPLFIDRYCRIRPLLIDRYCRICPSQCLTVFVLTNVVIQFWFSPMFSQQHLVSARIFPSHTLTVVLRKYYRHLNGPDL